MKDAHTPRPVNKLFENKASQFMFHSNSANTVKSLSYIVKCFVLAFKYSNRDKVLAACITGYVYLEEDVRRKPKCTDDREEYLKLTSKVLKSDEEKNEDRINDSQTTV